MVGPERMLQHPRSTRRSPRTPVVAIVVGVLWAMLVSAPVAAIGISFEDLLDGESVGNHYAGLTFANATALTAGLSLDEFEFPPHSGANVVFDDGGRLSVTFATPVTSVMGYFTYLLDPGAHLMLDAYDALGTPLGSATSAFSSNAALSGEPGSTPNELLGLTFAQGVGLLVVTGAPGGGSFVLDDLSFARDGGGTVPEPASVALLALGLLVMRTRRPPAA